MRLFKITGRLFPHRHKLKIVDCKMERNGHKLYGVICSRCLTIVEAGVSYEQANEAVKTIKSGKRIRIEARKPEALSRRLTIPIPQLQNRPDSLAQ